MQTGSLLQLQNLTKRFGDLTAVDNLNLEVYPGEIFALLGPNGAGKTTTIRMVAGLLLPDSGTIRLGGEQILQGGQESRTRLGICPQENVHWDKLSPAEQLHFLGNMYGMPSQAIHRQTDYLLEHLELAEVRNQLAGRLSGGMKRRLNIALALIHDPEILILDEPEAGLDPQSRIQTRKFFRDLAQQKTIILTTHNMDEADRLADRLAVMDRGKLLVIDTPEKLKASVGEGDVLELALSGSAMPARLEELDWDPGLEIRQVDDMLVVRGLDLVNRLPEILDWQDRQGLGRGEIKLRKNTLEDVFIQLTGRRLQE